MVRQVRCFQDSTARCVSRMGKRCILMLMIILLFHGCFSFLDAVRPYQREILAQKKMLITPFTSKESQEGHVFLIREASSGGETSFQGGCGCR